jgi:xylem cysteine proteinase
MLNCTIELYKEFTQKHQIPFEFERIPIFCDNLSFINQHNNKTNQTYKLAVNQFAHLTHKEFVGLYTSNFEQKNNFIKTKNFFRKNDFSLEIPSEIDWVSLGGVTSVKDQGQCGSCWSFSTTGSMEGAYFIKTNKLVSFSEQMLVDCSSPMNHGCNGGLMDRAFRWISNEGGLCSEDDYPYTSGTTLKAGVCQEDSCEFVPESKVSGWTDLDSTDSAFVSALSQQPVSVAIEADQRAFQFYSSGILPASECGVNLDHGVLAVGYDNNSYKIKNSWGPTWGDEGYIYLERSSSAEKQGGTCGVLLSASFVTL